MFPLPKEYAVQHPMNKGELYKGKKIIYHATFDKFDKVEDYKVAWVHFERIFKAAK